MSPKDKKILKVMFIFLLIFLPSYFYTRKLIADIIEREKHIDALMQEESMFQSMLENISRKEAFNGELEVEFANSAPNTESFVKSYEVHYFLTEIAEKNRLTLTSLTLEEPKLLTPGDGDVSNSADANAIVITPEQFEEFGNEAYSVTAGEDFREKLFFDTRLYELAVSMSVNGGMNDILSAIDEINAYSDYISITSFKVTDMLAEDGISADIPLNIYYTVIENKEVE